MRGGGGARRNPLDTTVAAIEQLRALPTHPSHAVGYDAKVRKRPLTVHEVPYSPRSEAFRQLRTNLQFVNVDHPHKVSVVTSSLPGEGKTTTTLNLAIALASSGQKVLVIEADLRRPGADRLLIEGAVGLTNVLAGRVQLPQAIQPWSGDVDLLASGPLPPNPSELSASRHMEAPLKELRDQYDMVLIDTPPLLPVTHAAAAAPATDGVLLVSRFQKTTCEQVAARCRHSRRSPPLLVRC